MLFWGVNEKSLLPGYGNFQYNGPANGNANYNPYGNAQYGAGYGGNYNLYRRDAI